VLVWRDVGSASERLHDRYNKQQRNATMTRPRYASVETAAFYLVTHSENGRRRTDATNWNRSHMSFDE